MANLTIFSLLLLLTHLTLAYYIKDGHHNITLSNFAFGSCFEGFLADRWDIFKSILKEKPEMWLWLGDATYLDNITTNYFYYDKQFHPYYVEKMFNLTKKEESIIIYFRFNFRLPNFS